MNELLFQALCLGFFVCLFFGGHNLFAKLPKLCSSCPTFPGAATAALIKTRHMLLWPVLHRSTVTIGDCNFALDSYKRGPWEAVKRDSPRGDTNGRNLASDVT